MSDQFDLEQFLPYLLNQAGERVSREFEQVYQSRYGMARTHWRVMALLGKYGPLLATQICDRGALEKTKVSRAVRALDERGWLTRTRKPEDQRAEILSLTEGGSAVFAHLSEEAQAFNHALLDTLPEGERAALIATLRGLARIDG